MEPGPLRANSTHGGQTRKGSGVGPSTQFRLRSQDAGTGRLAAATRPGEEVGMVDAVVAQRSHQRAGDLLPWPTTSANRPGRYLRYRASDTPNHPSSASESDPRAPNGPGYPLLPSGPGDLRDVAARGSGSVCRGPDGRVRSPRRIRLVACGAPWKAGWGTLAGSNPASSARDAGWQRRFARESGPAQTGPMTVGRGAAAM